MVVVPVQIFQLLYPPLHEERRQHLIMELASWVERLGKGAWSGYRVSGQRLQAQGGCQIRRLISSVDLTIRLMKSAHHTLLIFHIIIFKFPIYRSIKTLSINLNPKLMHGPGVAIFLHFEF